MMFLHSLNSEYTAFKDRILAGETIPMASQALSRLMRKKQENIVTLPHPMGSSTLISSGFCGGRGSGSGRGNVCGNRGGGRGGRGNLGNLKCTFCGRTNHLEDRCWKKYGKPEWANQVFEESYTSNAFVPLAGGVSPTSSSAVSLSPHVVSPPPPTVTPSPFQVYQRKKNCRELSKVPAVEQSQSSHEVPSAVSKTPRVENSNLECCLFVLFPYFSYMLAEGLDLYAIVSILFIGMVMKHYTFSNLSENSQQIFAAFFHLISSLAETFVLVISNRAWFLIIVALPDINIFKLYYISVPIVT
ncbi:hypothetical protein IFM89_031602 [Coptis chinensis]|uniref:Cation/H+ exchanger transmembrane domain-containing protein n=1 Tax=Coptis chinensis TaxID=261450 RepID=A0A835H9L1_9MAGN|nr:hypothetical protein IFM89_031602 [Coptis chinensis]